MKAVKGHRCYEWCISVGSDVKAMPTRPVNVYVLRLTQGKYYVGKSYDVVRRVEDHHNSQGCYWTRMYPPVEVMAVYNNCDHFDEDKHTITMMAKYGIDNVRGGTFSRVQLSDTDREVIERMLRSGNDACFRCGSTTHWVDKCPLPQTTVSVQTIMTNPPKETNLTPPVIHDHYHRQHSLPTLHTTTEQAITSCGGAQDVFLLVRKFVSEMCLVGSNPETGQIYRVNVRVLRETLNIELNTRGMANIGLDVFLNILLHLVPGVVYHRLREDYVFDGITLAGNPRVIGNNANRSYQLRQERNKRYYDKAKVQKDTTKKQHDDTLGRLVEFCTTGETYDLDPSIKENLYQEQERLLGLLSTEQYLIFCRMVHERVLYVESNVASNVSLTKVQIQATIPQARLRLKIINKPSM